MKKYKITEDNTPIPPQWLFYPVLFIFILIGSAFLADGLGKITERERERIVISYSNLAPEPDRQYDTRLEEYKWDPKTKTYRRIK